MTLTADNASYLLRGKCSEVVVTGVDSTVTMRSVGYLKIRGTGNQIDAREVRTLVVTGDGGHTLGIDAVRLLQLRSSDQSVTVTGRVGRALVLGQDHVLRAPPAPQARSAR